MHDAANLRQRSTQALKFVTFSLPRQLRYANNSNYKNDTLIKKESFVSAGVLSELKRIIADSEVSGSLLREP